MSSKYATAQCPTCRRRERSRAFGQAAISRATIGLERVVGVALSVPALCIA